MTINVKKEYVFVKRGTLMGNVKVRIDYDKPLFLPWEHTLDSLAFVESVSDLGTLKVSR